MMKTAFTHAASTAVLVLGLAFAAEAPALAQSSAAPAQTVADVSQAHKVVAIGGSVTEIIYALGLEDRLVARDSTSLYPQQALALPDVGYIRALSPEGVLSTGMDAIVALEGSGPPETMTVLAEAGVPIVLVPEAYSAQGILDKIEVVGQAMGAQDKADVLIEQLKQELAAAEAEAAARPGDTKVLFVLSLQGGNVLASGEGTAADGVLKMAHLTNAVSGFSGYKPLSNEAVTEAAPDVILMMSGAGDHSARKDTVLTHPALGATPAGKNERIIAMNGLYLLGFGPRTASAVTELSAEVSKLVGAGSAK
ncbi:heme/hemin ABC transporter substrate-binding protein [Roseibium sp.]|uniref:heme/hemin ABC transporter substrate-binding protein n=1 Tax=Roseibium sp. TaxID=1936156 RepID=UPI003A970464